MQESCIVFIRKSGIKFIFILLFLVFSLVFVLNIYSQESSFMKYTKKFRRESKYEELMGGRKILERFSQNTNFPELNLDTEVHELKNDELIEAIEAELPSLPFSYWYRNQSKHLEKSTNCAKFPDLLHLNYFNKYWQTFQLENITFQLYNAFYDYRPTVTADRNVRLIAMINSTEPRFPPFYCQLWYDGQLQPVHTNATLSMIWYYAWGHARDYLYPYLVTCLLPADVQQRIPKVVSLVSNECERAGNSLRVHYEQPQSPIIKQQFAVCVKGLDYPNIDISARLVEWIELQQILGASKIFFYLLQVHPNVSKVLQHYTRLGVIDVRPITLADGVPSTPQLQHYILHSSTHIKRLNELIPYNDCFYRNIYNYDYIALEDIDEVLMPLGNRTTWAELVEVAATERTKNCKDGYASYCFRNVYFPDFSNETGLLYYPEGVPSYAHMLEHVQRSSQHLEAGFATKCLHRTSHVLTLHNHFALDWKNVCPAWTFPTEVAQMNHYRHEDKKENLTESVRDMSLWRFKNVLLERSMKAFEEIDLFENLYEDYS